MMQVSIGVAVAIAIEAVKETLHPSSDLNKIAVHMLNRFEAMENHEAMNRLISQNNARRTAISNAMDLAIPLEPTLNIGADYDL